MTPRVVRRAASVLVAALCAPFVLWWGTWAAFALRAALPVRRPAAPRARRFDVVVPAHDEAAHIGELVRSLRAQEGEATIGRILVVADHCSDATADVARAAGAEVLVRDDGAPGKPPALREGISRLAGAADRGEAVVLLDGDCVVGPGFATALAERLHPDVDVVQAAYTLDEPADDAVRANLRLGFALRNVVRARGADALGVPVVLFGSGMLFRWDVLDHLSFGDPRIAGTGDTRPVADDVLMALDLLAAGVHVAFAEGATVVAPTPADEHGLGAQRLRWEGGQALMWRRVPRALLAVLRRRDWRGALGLVDWTAPPLVPSVALVGVVGGGAAVLAPLGVVAPVVLAVPATAATMLTGYLLVGVASLEGRAGVVRLFTSGPRFLRWKLRLYLSHRTARRAPAPGHDRP